MKVYLPDAQMTNFVFPVYIIQRLSLQQYQFELHESKNTKFSQQVQQFIDCLLRKDIQKLLTLMTLLTKFKSNYYSTNLFCQFKIAEHHLFEVQDVSEIPENLKPFLTFYLSLGQVRGEFKKIQEQIYKFYMVQVINAGTNFQKLDCKYIK